MLAFKHRFIPATAPGRPPLLLLHGTGGNEDDLIPLGKALAPGAALLSPRGQVLEHGMPRFFSRLAEGVFDPAEVRARSNDLADFVAEACRTYDLPAPIAVGFSNGGNIAATVMLLRPGILLGAVLLRPMLVLDEAATGSHAGAVLMLSGASDSMATPASARALVARLQDSGATVDHRVLPGGHQLTQADVEAARAWLAQRTAGAS